MARFDRTIPPGGKGTITLAVRTKGYQGNIHKKARVFTNDPQKTEVVIGIKGKLWVPIRMSGHRVFLRGIAGEEIASSVQAHGQKDEPLALKVISVSIPDKIAVELHQMDKEGSYEVHVKNKLSTGATYSGTIRLGTNYPEEPEIRVHILGNIRALVQTTPRILTFGQVSEKRLQELKKSGFVMTRPVMVVLTKGDGLKLEGVEFEKSLFKATTREIQPGSRFQLLVKPILERLTKGKNNDVLKIRTNQQYSELLEIPVRFEIFQ